MQWRSRLLLVDDSLRDPLVTGVKVDLSAGSHLPPPDEDWQLFMNAAGLETFPSSKQPITS